MKIYETIRPLGICHPTMRLLSAISESTLWVCEEENLSELEIWRDPKIDVPRLTGTELLSKDQQQALKDVEPTYHAIQDLPEKKGYVVTLACVEHRYAAEMQLYAHSNDRRYVLGEHTLIVGCRVSDDPMIVLDFQAIPQATLPLFVSVLIDHCVRSNPYLVPEETYNQQVRTYNNPLLNALIEAWLASGELVLSE